MQRHQGAAAATAPLRRTAMACSAIRQFSSTLRCAATRIHPAVRRGSWTLCFAPAVRRPPPACQHGDLCALSRYGKAAPRQALARGPSMHRLRALRTGVALALPHDQWRGAVLPPSPPDREDDTSLLSPRHPFLSSPLRTAAPSGHPGSDARGHRNAGRASQSRAVGVQPKRHFRPI